MSNVLKKVLSLHHQTTTKIGSYMETTKSLDYYAFSAWKALHAYQHALWKEFSQKCDPLDPDFLSMRKTYYETHDYITDMMRKLDELPNPFDNIFASSNNNKNR